MPGAVTMAKPTLPRRAKEARSLSRPLAAPLDAFDSNPPVSRPPPDIDKQSSPAALMVARFDCLAGRHPSIATLSAATEPAIPPQTNCGRLDGTSGRRMHPKATIHAPKFALAARPVLLSPAIASTQVAALGAIMAHMYPDVSHSDSAVLALVQQAYRSAEDVYDEDDALVWAGDYQFPAGIGTRDALGIQTAGSLAAYTREVQARLQQSGRGLSTQSIATVVPADDPDYDRLMALVDGIPIFAADDFSPNLAPPELRAKYIRLAPVVNRLMADLYDAGLIFIIPTEEAIKIPGIHFSQTHWAFKRGKRFGRPIGDASAREEGGCALNSAEVKLKGEEVWGKIYHPTVEQLAEMILRQAARGTPGDPVVLWKMDLKGAFTLLLVHPESVQRLAFALTTDADGLALSMAYITGMFGWSCMPAAFQVVTRVIQRAVNSMTLGEALMYVDDLMGACLLSELAHDQDKARWVCNTLLGAGAIAESKTFSGRSLDFIGWEFDTMAMTISIAKHNFDKTLLGFLSTDETSSVAVATIQRLASWASRYGLICRMLRPYTMDLFSSIRGYTNGCTRIALPPAAQRAIRMWRGAMITLGLDPSQAARPIHTVAPRAPGLVLEYDASLTGIGILLREFNPQGEPVLIRAIKLPIPFDLATGGSGNQNTAEFTAIVTGLACLVSLGYSNQGILLKGDNTSSLAWSAAERFQQGPSRPAAMLFMALAVIFDLQVCETLHVPGVVNVICDKLSRDGSYTDCGFTQAQCYDFQAYPQPLAALAACDPLVDHTSDSKFFAAWRATNVVVRALVAV